MSSFDRHFQQEFVGSLEQLAPIRDFVLNSAAQCGCGEEDAFALELACDEASANVFRHTFEGKPGRLAMEIWRADAQPQVFVRMTYGGRSFDPSRVPEPDLNLPMEQRPTGGLGLYFMRRVMAEVKFEFDDRRGNVLTMRRPLSNHLSA